MSWDGFFPNFLGVILGILITFGGNTLWQNYEEKKKTKEMLTLLSSELHRNKVWVEDIRKLMQEDSRVYGKILESKDKWESIPQDTLNYYYFVATRFPQHELTTTAWEIFQNSEVIQKMPNKDLLLNLSSCYFWLTRIQDNYRGTYNDDKEKAKVYEIDPVKYFDTAMEKKEAVYIYTKTAQISSDQFLFFTQVGGLIDSIIQLLDKEIGDTNE